MAELNNIGDCLRAERIAAEASEIAPIRVAKRSAAHKGQSTVLTRNAYCVIEMPLKWILDQKTNKK